MFLSAHYTGDDLVPKFQAGEEWKKVFGPVFLYVNSVADPVDPLFLWEGAKLQVFLLLLFLYLFLSSWTSNYILMFVTCTWEFCSCSFFFR